MGIGVAARIRDKNIAGQILRHRWRAIGLAYGIRFERKISFRLARNHCFAGGGFKQTTLNPFLERLQILVRQRWLVRRHGGIFRLRDCLPKLARVGIARNDDDTRAAAFEQVLITGQIEVGFFLIVIMTLGAIGLNERQNVILISDFILGARDEREPQHCQQAESKRETREIHSLNG